MYSLALPVLPGKRTSDSRPWFKLFFEENFLLPAFCHLLPFVLQETANEQDLPQAWERKTTLRTAETVIEELPVEVSVPSELIGHDIMQ